MVLTFTQNVTEINVTVKVTNDKLVEIDENFWGDLTTSIDGVIIDPGEAKVTILDKDSKLLRSNFLCHCVNNPLISCVQWL